MYIYFAVYLSRQMLRNKVSSWFLAQVYLATILVFAGLYAATYKLDVSHFVYPCYSHDYSGTVFLGDVYSNCAVLFCSIRVGKT